MAIMINCATDWTFDLFCADCEQYKATPIKGVHVSRNASDREKFIVWLKNMVRDFRADFRAENDGKDIALNYSYSAGLVYVGDFFKRELWESGFSDYYKDVYGQRPHLDTWYYIYMLGLSTCEDTFRTFCAHPIENAIENAQRERNREW